jgi:hypothetical protein
VVLIVAVAVDQALLVLQRHLTRWMPSATG